MLHPKFFIFGSARSGTTLLGALLTSHPEVFVLNDSFIFEQYANVHKNVQRLRPELIPFKFVKRKAQQILRTEFLAPYRVLKALKEKKAKTGSYIPRTKSLPAGEYLVSADKVEEFFAALIERYTRPLPGEHTPTWLKQYADVLIPSAILRQIPQAGEDEFSLRTLFDMTFSQLIPGDQRRKNKLGEKTPSHLYYSSSWIRALYPTAKLITLVRDPIPNVASLYKYSAATLNGAIKQYLSCYDAIFNFLYEGKEALLVRYEDLLKSPVKTLSSVYRHLDVDADEISTEFSYYIKKDYVGKRIDPGRDKRLREMLSKNQKMVIRERCRHVYEEFYPEQI